MLWTTKVKPSLFAGVKAQGFTDLDPEHGG